MKALRFDCQTLTVSDVGHPDRQGEAVVRVLKSGICNTDLEIVRGYAGFSGTIGHEFVGICEQADDVPHLIGKRVVGEINAGCGKCVLCAEGDARHCPNRTVLGIVGRDGCHAEFLNLPSINLLEIPDSVTDEEAVFVEPLAAAYGILEQLAVTPEMRVAVIGDGKLGILCAQSLHLATRNTFLIGKHHTKMQLAEARGIETVGLEAAPKLNRTFDAVVEASGSESGFATALDLLKPRGKLVLKSTFSGRPSWEAWRVVVDEITIIGSRCGRFAPAVKLLEEKKVEVKSLISEEFRLGQGISAVQRASHKEVMKVLLTP